MSSLPMIKAPKARWKLDFPHWVWSSLLFIFVVIGCASLVPRPSLTPSLIEGGTSVSGSGVPNATIEVLVNGQSVAKGSTSEEGDFHLNVPPLQAIQTVTATQNVGGLTSVPSLPVIVQKARLTQIIIQPTQSFTLEQGETQTFSVRGTYSNGVSENPLRGVNWKSDNSAVVTVNAQGQIRGKKVGAAGIWCSRGDVYSTQTIITVKPVPPKIVGHFWAGDHKIRGEADPFAHIRLFVNGDLADETILADAQGQWQTNGLLSLEENARITSTQIIQHIQSDPSDSLTVGPAVLTDIDIHPTSSVTIQLGQEFGFIAAGTYSDGKIKKPLASVMWHSENPSIATIDEGGSATGINPGLVSIQAYLDGIQSKKTLLAVEPNPPTISTPLLAGETMIGGTADPMATVKLAINGKFQDVEVLVDAQGNWLADAIEPLSENDDVTSIQIVNRIPSPISPRVLVAQAGLIHLEIHPTHVQLKKNGPSQALLAMGTYSDGKVERPLTGVLWLTTRSDVATVDSKGQVFGVGIGTATIQAFRDGLPSSKVLVSVMPSPPVITSSIKAGDKSVSGMAEAGAHIQIYLDGERLGGPVLADAEGRWEARNLPSLETREHLWSIQTVNNLQSAPSRVLTVNPNHPPVIKPIEDQTVRLGDTLNVRLVASDPDADELTFKIINPPQLVNSTLALKSGLLTYTPVAEHVGQTELTFQVSDGNLTAEGTFTLNVTLPNSLIVLLDNPDGTVGKINVTNAGETRVLDQPIQAVRLVSATAPPSEPFMLKEKDIQDVFKETLEANPDEPITFILYFNSDTAELSPDSLQQLPEILSSIAGRSVPHIGVIGHTDRTASPDYNHQLSVLRAQAVRDILVRSGVDPQVIDVTGHGENNPLIETPDDVKEPLNRRVEIVVQ